MKLLADRLMPMQSPLFGFNGEAVVLEGITTLPMTLGTNPRHLILMIDFMVVKVPSTYNMILGRSTMRMTEAIYPLTMLL